MRLTRREFNRGALLSIGGCMTSTFGLAAEQDINQESRPNILFLLTDDQRWDHLGCTGGGILRTPNLDSLAAQGVIFENSFCTTSICCSSRASILTGLYTRSHGVEQFDTPLAPEMLSASFPVRLRHHGYRTGFVGKWGLGGPQPHNAFDFWRGFEGQGKYYHERDGQQVHLNRMLLQQALEFLDGTSPGQPFCLSLSFKSPHEQDGDPWPFQAEQDLAHLYQNTKIPPPPASSIDDFEALPPCVQNSEGRRRWDLFFGTPERYERSVKDIYRLISGVDRVVGQIFLELRRRGVSGNTVIIFTSDNGALHGEHGLAGKWLMYEQSIRVPLLIYDPRLPSHLRGRRVSRMALNVDICPTILELAGVTPSAMREGMSLAPLLRNRVVQRWRGDWFYEHHYDHHGKIPAVEGVRTDQWKYCIYPECGGAEQLFDLHADPHEQHNLINQPYAAPTLRELRRRHQALRLRP